MLAVDCELRGSVIVLILLFFMSLSASAGQQVVTISKDLQLIPYETKVLGFNTPMGAPAFDGNYASSRLLLGADKLP
ncbi:MAG: hypothetical protein ACQ9ET_05450, partial [Nitrosomonadaceae bacterium]